MSALRLNGPAPEREPHPAPAETGGRMITYRGAGCRAHPYRKVVSGRGECPVSGDDFAENERVWQSDSGHLYRPWSFVRAAKTMGWRDCQSNREVSVADRERLEAELNRLVHNNGPHATPAAAREANRVAQLAREALDAPVVRRDDPEEDEDDDEVDDEDEDEDDVRDVLSARAAAHGLAEEWRVFGYDSLNEHWRGEHVLPRGWVFFLNAGLVHPDQWVPREMIDYLTERVMERMREARGYPVPRVDVESEQAYEWTNPCALGGNLRISWTAADEIRYEETDGGTAERRTKSGRFELLFPLVHGNALTKLIVGMASAAHSINGEPGSPAKLVRTVLRALLLGDRTNRTYGTYQSIHLEDDELEAFAATIGEDDLMVEFYPGVASYVELIVYVSVPLMAALLADSSRTDFRGRAATALMMRRRGDLHGWTVFNPPRPREAWGNLTSDVLHGMPPGWMPEGANEPSVHARDVASYVRAQGEDEQADVDGLWRAQFIMLAGEHWKDGVVRMLQLANNLTMLALGFGPADVVGMGTEGMTTSGRNPEPYYMGAPLADDRTVIVSSPERMLWQSFRNRTVLGPPCEGYRSPPAFLEITQTIDIPFWYGIDNRRVGRDPGRRRVTPYVPPFDHPPVRVNDLSVQGPPTPL